MEDTACGADCKFIKAKFCKRCEDCPLYVESWWQSKDKQPRLVKDCFPKRSLLLQQEIINRSLATQAANEENRNEMARMTSIFRRMIESSLTLLSQNTKQIT